jgi:hypothetical protein
LIFQYFKNKLKEPTRTKEASENHFGTTSLTYPQISTIIDKNNLHGVKNFRQVFWFLQDAMDINPDLLLKFELAEKKKKRKNENIVKLKIPQVKINFYFILFFLYKISVFKIVGTRSCVIKVFPLYRDRSI